MNYNTSRESFPNTIIANKFGFKEAQLWEIEDETFREAPKVSF